MNPGRDLTTLLHSLAPVMADGIFVYTTLAPGDGVPPGLTPVFTFDEAEGQTLVLLESQALGAGLPFTFPCRQITLTVHSALDAVGFLAALTAALADAGIPANAVSAFHHDHLFVPVDRADEAIAVLERFQRAK